MKRITVFTPTFNRANTLYRVFNSLESQTFKDFNWIIVDDGSTDNTKDVVQTFINKSTFEIKYFYKENGGKHTAINLALTKTDSEFFLIADSDDSFRSDALETFYNTWLSIPLLDRKKFKGIIARCYDIDTGKGIGKFPEDIFDSNDLEALFKLKLRFEKWNIVRTDVMREFAFPEPNERLKFYPETVIWCRMARKYKTRYIDKTLRGYYRDQDNSLVSKSNSNCKETIYLWQYYINEAMDYLYKQPKYFFQAFIGFSRDCILSNYSYHKSIKRINRLWKKMFITLLYPLGWIFAIIKRIENR